MARLKVFHHKKWISSVDLKEDRKMFIGRSRECDFVMESADGISRKHFFVQKEKEGWIVERLSKTENLTFQNQPVSRFLLTEGSIFKVADYEFAFQLQPENTEVSEGQDRTVVLTLPTTAFLRWSDADGNVKKSFRLEGSYWIAGRERGSALFLDSPHVSRRQFEIQKNEWGYQVRHLGSVNPTKLNGEAIQDDWRNVVSGDVISLGELRLLFEIRRGDLDEKVSDDLLPVIFEKIEEVSPDEQPPGPVQFYDELEFVQPREERGSKKNMIYAVIGVLFVVGIYFYSQSQNPPPPPPTTSKKDPGPSPEKLAAAKQLYLTAQALLAQGKYELAKQQVEKLHQIVPQFEDSKEIETTANQGLTILAERDHALAEEKERAQIQEKLKAEVAKCRSQMNSHLEPGWMESCLTPATALSPEYPEIAQLKSSYEEKLMGLQIAKAQSQARKLAIQKQLDRFAKAKKLEQKGATDEAVDLYKKIERERALNRTNVPALAKRNIASIEDAVVKKQAAEEKEADAFYKKGDLPHTVEALRKAFEINQDNEVIRGKLDKCLKELSKREKELYQQSVLEESYGDVKAARAKWEKITGDSVSGEDFYEKAKSKLKRYGWWTG